METLLTADQYYLLIKDLGSRLTTEVYLQFGQDKVFGDLCSSIQLLTPNNFRRIALNAQYAYVRPYLRELSSMTDKEKEEFLKAIYGDDFDKESHVITYITDGAEYDDEGDACIYLTTEILSKGYNWLIEHQFDVNGLIKQKLALPAPTEMYQNNLIQYA